MGRKLRLRNVMTSHSGEAKTTSSQWTASMARPVRNHNRDCQSLQCQVNPSSDLE
ncbi:hypothetical protein KIN20_010217 [Parelaphostrongylus tenuis]|uniref:Uncharacterized protein n=1 Tax=Parelaphostrongylus tenuis TaxID=148309 RepID=A0AAD5M7L0_PARTN|nr:hypothetical protein KIN20_010217 [Parelaphostrongylus tenuis]